MHSYLRRLARGTCNLDYSRHGLNAFSLVNFGVITGELLYLLRWKNLLLVDTVSDWQIVTSILIAVLASVRVAPRITSVATLVALKYFHSQMLQSYDVDLKLQYFTLLLCFAPTQTITSDSDRSSATSPAHRIFTASVIIAVGLVYLDSMATKLASSIWINGSAVWFSCTLPYATSFNAFGFQPPKVLFQFATYATMVYEGLFLLAFLSPFRSIISCIGLLLHLSIAALLPLQFFGLLMCGPLLFLAILPTRVSYEPKSRTQIVNFFAIFGYLVTLCIIYFTDYTSNYSSQIAKFLGISSTGVYSDQILSLRNPIVRLELHDGSVIRSLPSFGQDGHTDFSNRIWKHFSFFSRMNPCPRRYFERHIENFATCGSFPCSVHFFTKDIHWPLEDFSLDLQSKLNLRPWKEVGKIRIDSERHWQWDYDIEYANAEKIFPFYCFPGKNIGEEIQIRHSDLVPNRAGH